MAAEIVLLPGTYDPATHALAGPLTVEMIRKIHSCKVFLVDSLSLKTGLTAANLGIAMVKRSRIGHTQGQVIVIADDSKFGRIAEVSIAALKYINVLITNQKIPDDFRREFEINKKW